ncbi:MAG: DUF721 domain-containing protein [Alphaproteobacteria bacterium]
MADDKKPHEDKRSFKLQPVAARLPALLRSSGRRRGFTEAHVLTAWHQICPEYHAYSRPTKLWETTLTVAVNSGSARANMQLWLPTLIERINTFYGYEAVTSIKCVTQAFAPKQAAPEAAKPLSQNALAKAAKLCESVQHEGLRESLITLGARLIDTPQGKKKENQS